MFSSSHPYSAVSVQIESLTSEQYDEDDYSGVPELIEAIRLQGTGAMEAARALRKKLKYANVHRQLRSLTILDGLLQNGGERLQRNLLSDPGLTERLRIAAVDPMSDVDVREKCKDLFGQWMASSKSEPGMKGAAMLYNQLPKKKTGQQQQRRDQSKALRETEEDARREVEDSEEDETPSRSTTRGEPSSPAATRKPSVAAAPPMPNYKEKEASTKKSKKDKKSKRDMFSLEKEKPAIYQAIAQSSVAATNLGNSLKRVNREHQRVSDDPESKRLFEQCKSLRRQILRFIHLVNEEEFLGGLIHANEELVTALMAFEVLDRSTADDSDSEMEEAQHLSRQAAKNEAAAQKEAEKLLAKLSVKDPAPAPPRPARAAAPAAVSMPATATKSKSKQKQKARRPVESESESEESDNDNPFGDRNVINTPDPDSTKKYLWKEV